MNEPIEFLNSEYFAHKRFKARQRMAEKNANRQFRPVDTSRPKRPWDYYIPMGSGRPTRVTIISEDDVRNFLIALNTASTWEEFLFSI